MYSFCLYLVNKKNRYFIMQQGEFVLSNSLLIEETLRINRSAKNIKGRLAAFSWIDADTNQHVVYIPSLEITGYGENRNKAVEMLDFSVKEYLTSLIRLPKGQLEEELFKLNFKKNKFFNKEFSKAYVDLAGELQNFNAVDNKVEKLTLESA